MNERIAELVKKAGINLTPAQFSGVLEDEVDEFTIKKFAELLVRECSDVCQQVTSSGMFDGNQQYASAYCRDEIKRHFGLE